MKTLFTSHYGKRHKDRAQVQISSYAPKGWNPPSKLFEPSLVWRHFVRRKEFKGDWRTDYLEQLKGMLADGSLQAALDRIPDGAVLLCWERDHCECHRKVLAEFLRENGMANVG